jgi:hypothetical protein
MIISLMGFTRSSFSMQRPNKIPYHVLLNINLLLPTIFKKINEFKNLTSVVRGIYYIDYKM